MARLPLHRFHAEGRRLQHELCQAESPSSFGHHRQGTVSHVRFLLSNHVLHI
jgi:hypothetical protein